MSQRERDRLKVLHEAKRGSVTPKQASEQLGVTERQVRRLLKRMRKVGDQAVVMDCVAVNRTGGWTLKRSGVR